MRGFLLVALWILGCSDTADRDAGRVEDVGGLDVPASDVPIGDAAAPDTGPSVSARIGPCGARVGTYFPASSWIYTDISDAPIAEGSDATTEWLLAQGGWGGSGRFQIDTGLVVLEADASTPRITPTDADPGERYASCDLADAIPIPPGGRIEGHSDYVCPERSLGVYTEDCHLLVVDFASQRLFESFSTSVESGTLYTTCPITWDMGRDHWGPRPAADRNPMNWGLGTDCTSADAAGFPIAPLLVTVGDVMSGRVEHVIRFILPNDRMRGPSGGSGPPYVWPGTHAGGPSATDPRAPLYASQWRLRADFDPAAAGLDPANPVVRAVIYGLQHYGMALADGGNIPLTFANDAGCGTGWDALFGDAGSRVLDGILPTDFEILATGPTETREDCVRVPR
jgi:serine/threonine-protein kinase